MSLPPAELSLSDGETAVLVILDDKAVSSAPGARGGTTYSIFVQKDGIPFVLKGGVRLWRALYPILVQGQWPCRVKVTSVGAPGNTSHDWKAERV